MIYAMNFDRTIVDSNNAVSMDNGMAKLTELFANLIEKYAEKIDIENLEEVERPTED